MASDKSNILIVDDHALFRSGVKEILTGCPGVGIIDEAANGAEAIIQFGLRHYDCVLLDIFMPGESGLEVIRRLKALDPEAHCLILSMYPEEQYGVRAIKAGAAGYLTKNVNPDTLKEAVRRVCGGQSYIDNLLADKLTDEIRGGGKAPHEKLSDRELQVLVLIASGKTVSLIAKELYLSVKTVSAHRANILRKMGLTNTSELIQYAVKNGLVY